MTREQFEAAVAHLGWQRDRFGHFHKGEYRFRCSTRTVQLQASYRTDTQKRWLTTRKAYYTKLSLTAEGKLSGFTR